MNVVKFLPASVAPTAGRFMLVAKKNSPSIMFTAGVVGAVTATVLACRATLQLESILTESQETLARIDSDESESYPQELKDKRKAAVRVKTGLNIVKLYGPAFIIGAGAVASLTGSHYIMSKRQASLMAAYAGLDQAFREYQERVREEVGIEREEHLRKGFIETTVKNDEGKKIKQYRADPNGRSVYTRVFAEGNKNWSPDQGSNLLFLRAQEAYANDILKSTGYIFLNDVYKMLGFQPTEAGQMVGWFLGNGDNYVDFDIFHKDSERTRAFINLEEASVWLDFNVDGVIYDKLDSLNKELKENRK